MHQNYVGSYLASQTSSPHSANRIKVSGGAAVAHCFVEVAYVV